MHSTAAHSGGCEYSRTMSWNCDAQWNLGPFERSVPVRLEREGLPDAGDSGRTHAAFGAHRARAPVRRCTRQRLQNRDHHAFNVIVSDLARGTRTGRSNRSSKLLPSKRLRHLPTAARAVPSSAATAVSLRPAALPSTIRVGRQGLKGLARVLDRRT